MSSYSIAYHTPKFQEYSNPNNPDTNLSNNYSYPLNNTSSYNYKPIEILFIKAFIACLTSGLGGLPIYFLGKKYLTNNIMGFCIIFAAGLMTGCSVVLYLEALQNDSLLHVTSYFTAGMLLIWSINHIIPDIDYNIGGITGKNARQCFIIILSMMLHSLGEGISVGVSNTHDHTHQDKSNSDTNSIGLLVIISLAIHNIPEGISICILLMSRGMSIPMSSLFAIISNLPQPLIAIPSFLFIDYFNNLLSFGFSFASGAMTYIVFTELIPEAKDKISKQMLISSFCTSIGIIIAIAVCNN